MTPPRHASAHDITHRRLGCRTASRWPVAPLDPPSQGPTLAVAVIMTFVGSEFVPAATASTKLFLGEQPLVPGGTTADLAWP